MNKKAILVEVVRLRLSTQEYKAIKAAAEKAQRTISDYMRLVLTGKLERIQ